MSTRANVIIQEKGSKLFFYRHSDGYPECTGEDLKKFVQDYQNGNMRADVMQSAGWLILRGHKEYLEDFEAPDAPFTAQPSGGSYGWKVGAYEPTTSLHAVVAYIYIIDLDKRTLTTREPLNAFWDKPTLTNTEVIETFSFKFKEQE